MDVSLGDILLFVSLAVTCPLASLNLPTVHSFLNLLFVLCDENGGVELFLCPEGSTVLTNLALLQDYTLEELCECPDKAG